MRRCGKRVSWIAQGTGPEADSSAVRLADADVAYCSADDPEQDAIAHQGHKRTSSRPRQSDARLADASKGQAGLGVESTTL